MCYDMFNVLNGNQVNYILLALTVVLNCIDTQYPSPLTQWAIWVKNTAIKQNWGKMSAILKSFKRNNNAIGTFSIPLNRHKYFWRTHWHSLSDLSFSRQNPYHVQLREWLPRRHLNNKFMNGSQRPISLNP